MLQGGYQRVHNARIAEGRHKLAFARVYAVLEPDKVFPQLMFFILAYFACTCTVVNTSFARIIIIYVVYY